MPRKLTSLLSSGAYKNEAGEASATGAEVGTRPGWFHRLYERAKQRMSSERYVIA